MRPGFLPIIPGLDLCSSPLNCLALRGPGVVLLGKFSECLFDLHAASHKVLCPFELTFSFSQNFTWEELIMPDYSSKYGAVCMDGRHFTRCNLFIRQYTAMGEGQS